MTTIEKEIKEAVSSGKSFDAFARERGIDPEKAFFSLKAAFSIQKMQFKGIL